VIVIPEAANGSAQSAARWQAPWLSGIHVPGDGYGFRVRANTRPGM